MAYMSITVENRMFPSIVPTSGNNVNILPTLGEGGKKQRRREGTEL